ncbi:MAG TPA: antibiotic biosynthesis monooxygenase [Vitreimonas sp.]|jgi:heme-degrading monooxygenase HmoA|nr:antibiotic biosynthesis monooxygenase [Vitreimonas sp.]
MSYVIVWTYEVPPPATDEFIAAYGPEGDWAQLFAKGAGFIGVELYRDGQTFLTLDRWRSADAFNAFQAAFGAHYQALDAKLAHLTSSQARIGAFTSHD